MKKLIIAMMTLFSLSAFSFTSNNEIDASLYSYLKWENNMSGASFEKMGEKKLHKVHILNLDQEASLDMYANRIVSVFEVLYQAKPVSEESAAIVKEYIRGNYGKTTVSELATIISSQYYFDFK